MSISTTNATNVCEKIFSHYQTLYPVLNNVKLVFSETFMVNDVQASGATVFEDVGKNRNSIPMPTHIHITTHICKRFPRPEKDMVQVLLHEMSHAVNYIIPVVNSDPLPVYQMNDKKSTKFNRKLHAQRNYVDSHHPPAFWDRYAELMKIAVKNGFVNFDKNPDEITVDFMKRIDKGH
jgi:hypothetical protein